MRRHRRRGGAPREVGCAQVACRHEGGVEPGGEALGGPRRSSGGGRGGEERSSGGCTSRRRGGQGEVGEGLRATRGAS